MGHLILISDDIVAALEHYPHSLLEALSPYVPQPDWDNFVVGQYKETKERDLSQLGGGKPAVSAAGAGMGRGAPIGGLATNRFGDTPSPRMETSVGRGVGPVPREVRGGADFGPAEPDSTLTPSEQDQVSPIPPGQHETISVVISRTLGPSQSKATRVSSSQALHLTKMMISTPPGFQPTPHPEISILMLPMLQPEETRRTHSRYDVSLILLCVRISTKLHRRRHLNQ